MELGKELEKIIKFSFIDFFKSKEMKSLMLKIGIVYAIFFIIYMLIGLYYYQMPLDQTVDFLTSSLIEYTIIITILSILIAFVIVFFEYKVLQEALLLKKIKSTKIDFIKYLKFLLAFPIVFLCAAISIYNIKLLAIGIIGVIIIALGFFLTMANLMWILLIAIGVLVLFVYSLFVIYQFVRLVLTPAIIVTGKGIKESLDESLELTKNNFLNIFVILLVVFFIMYFLSMIVIIPSMLYTMTVSFASPEDSIRLFFSPMYNMILLLPSLIIGIYFIFVDGCVLASIYKILKK